MYGTITEDLVDREAARLEVFRLGNGTRDGTDPMGDR
jgi:hypothetical protein